MLRALHKKLPKRLQEKTSEYYWNYQGKKGLLKDRTAHIHPDKKSSKQIEKSFKKEFFEPEEYKKYRKEFSNGEISKTISQAKKQYQKLSSSENFGSIDLQEGFRLYALTRSIKPEKIVETGVCNGASTLCILLALEKNNKGKLYSIDFPFRADESLEEFRSNTFEDYGGAAIPSDKDPGWIIPDRLREKWDLIIGKSQSELPKLITDLEEIEMFFHDSEHSVACMMFEYEIAFQHLTKEGLIVSDDINWNSAFDKFTDCRDCKSGKISKGIGYIEK